MRGKSSISARTWWTCVSPGRRKTPTEPEKTVEAFNAQKLDGILIVLLAYSQGAWLLRALQNNRLPIALAIVQPDQEVGTQWKELDLTVNQGIDGAQDNANMIMKEKFPCQLFAGNRHEERFHTFVEDFGRASAVYEKMRDLRVAIFGRMGGMGDILTDDMAYYSKIGPGIRPPGPRLHRHCHGQTERCRACGLHGAGP